MSLTITNTILATTTAPAFEALRGMRYGSEERDVEVNVSRLTNDDLAHLRAAAEQHGDKKSVRAIDAILGARQGKFGTTMPNFKAFEGMLLAFLQHELIDGWLYSREHDGKLYPELVTSIRYDDGRRHGRDKPEPKVTIYTACYARAESRRGEVGMGVATRAHTFVPSDVVNKRVADALQGADLYKENEELKADYEASLERHRSVTSPGFAKQFRFTGIVQAYAKDDYQRRGHELAGRKVVHDLSPSECAAFKPHTESQLFDSDVGEVPEHPLVRVFDLKSHEFMWVHADYLTPYVYDKELGKKLILPKSHRDLLDVLTSDLDAFTADIIEGKSAGNIVLCKGRPGVGKTLTAEVYSELIEAPLYSVHSGTLGTTAEDVEKNLEMVFMRAKRWGAPILLDEADVFVMQRGSNLELNSIVAVFLRTLEYVDMLMFLTTNRSSEIDDAIINRTAAVISYEPPPPEDATAVWRVMAAQFQAQMDADLIAGLVRLFPHIVPRDIKMLLRLALRVARKREVPLTLDLFRQCAMFRAVTMANEVVQPVVAA